MRLFLCRIVRGKTQIYIANPRVRLFLEGAREGGAGLRRGKRVLAHALAPTLPEPGGKGVPQL